LPVFFFFFLDTIYATHTEEERNDCKKHLIQFYSTRLTKQDADLLRDDPHSYFKHIGRIHPEKTLFCDLALTLHAISATEMPCERQFSRIGWVVGDYRCSISDDGIVAISLLASEKQNVQKKKK
jgi:hypothetical protein